MGRVNQIAQTPFQLPAAALKNQVKNEWVTLSLPSFSATRLSWGGNPVTSVQWSHSKAPTDFVDKCGLERATQTTVGKWSVVFGVGTPLSSMFPTWKKKQTPMFTISCYLDGCKPPNCETAFWSHGLLPLQKAGHLWASGEPTKKSATKPSLQLVPPHARPPDGR